jgi:hypothetical protein
VVDFSRLVLRPAVRTFGRPITLHPLKSQPGQPAYTQRAVWSVKNVDIGLEDGKILSSDNLTLGVQLAAFAVAPTKGDRVEAAAYQGQPAIPLCSIDDTDDDGQGGSTWTLKKAAP